MIYKAPLNKCLPQFFDALLHVDKKKNKAIGDPIICQKDSLNH